MSLVRVRRTTSPHHMYCECPSIGDFYFKEELVGASLGFASPAYEKITEEIKAREACALHYCKLMIPVPRWHGPVNRKRLGEALRAMMRAVVDDDD